MSINFNDPMNDEARSMLHDLFGKPEAEDDRSMLFNKVLDIDRRLITDVANKAKQPVTVQLNDIGEVKTMSDGTQYRVTARGWVKL